MQLEHHFVKVLYTAELYNLMSMCNNTNITFESLCDGETRHGLFYIPVFLLGLFLNIAALLAFLRKRGSWTDTHIYLFNLVIADSAFVLFLPLRIWDAVYCLPKTYFCTFLINTRFINMYASIMITMAVSVHRYVVIKFPMKVKAWTKKKETAVVVCVVSWVVVLAICFIFREENSPDKLWTCYQRCKDDKLQLVFMLLLVCVGFLLPLFIIVFCSSQIIYILSKEEVLSEEKKNIIGIVKANMIIFIFCYTPLHVAFVVLYFYDPPPNWQAVALYMPEHNVFLVSEWIASTNCFFDCISYRFLLKGLLRSNNDSYELQDQEDFTLEEMNE